MDEEDFLELIISERMGMHRDAYRKEHPLTREEAAESDEAGRAHDRVFALLDGEHRKLLELYEDAVNAESVRECEFYYRAGIRDGMNLDRLVKQLKGNS